VSLSLALLAIGVRPGDDVLVPDFTMIATPNCLKMIGANPIFVDVERDNLCIDWRWAEAAVTSKTKALIYVSLNGRCGDLVACREMCQAHRIGLIEDSAQSLGSRKSGRHLGTFGQIGSFSFSVPKIITTGQGGALVTDDDELATRLRRLKDFGRDGGGNDIHNSIGYNFKFTDLQAVVGIEQMKKLAWRVGRKKEMFELYHRLLSGIGELEMIETNLADWCPWFIDVFLAEPDDLMAYLKANGVGSRRVYPPIHSQRAYQELNDLRFPVTERFSGKGLWLPSSSKLRNDEIEYVCTTIRQYFGGRRNL
jgi:perosamine synthetase